MYYYLNQATLGWGVGALFNSLPGVPINSLLSK